MKSLNINKMEQIIMSKTEVHNQNNLGINDGCPSQYRISSCLEFKSGSPNILPIRMKWKSPPYRSRSPGSSLRRLIRDCAPSARRQLAINNKEELFQINYNQYSIFNYNLIFKIMKKQFLLLVLAFFAINFTTAFGQLVCPVPRAVDITCLPNDAIHPMPGTLYNYIIDVPSPAGTKEYTWFVTQDKNFIVAPGTLTMNRETTAGGFLAVTGTGYNDPATATANLSLTWKSFVYDAANPLFVVVQVRSTVAGECSPNNMKVFKIEPVNSFTLDIANVGADRNTVSPYETNINRCISDIVSATFDPTAPEGILYDYGVDYLYYVVTAANFSTSWSPRLQLSGIDAKETVIAVEWFRPTDTGFATPEPMLLSAGTYTATNPVPALATNGTVGADGECIIIRVTLDHTYGANQYEGITDETITAAVDGKTQLTLPTPLGDIHFSKTVGNASDCGLEDGFRNDLAIQVLKARPNILSATPANPGPGNVPFLLVK